MSLTTKQIRDRKYYQRHKIEIIKNVEKWRQQNAERSKQSKAAYYQKNRQKFDELNKKWNYEHPEQLRLIKVRNITKYREQYQTRRKEIKKQRRLQLFDVLGGRVCIRCGYNKDSRALVFDHIRDDGYEDRKMHYGTYAYYRFYIMNPDIAKANLQVLCCNCNEIKKYDLMRYFH